MAKPINMENPPRTRLGDHCSSTVRSSWIAAFAVPVCWPLGPGKDSTNDCVKPFPLLFSERVKGLEDSLRDAVELVPEPDDKPNPPTTIIAVATSSMTILGNVNR